MATNQDVPGTPEEESKIVVQHMESFLAHKDRQIRELQHSLLNDHQWRSIPCDISNLVRSVDAVIDDSKDHVYLRQAKSDPAKIYHYQVLTGQWQQPIHS